MIDYSKYKILEMYNNEDIKHPIVLSIPHSGRLFIDEFMAKTNLSIDELRTSEDPYIDELVKPLIDQGFCAIKLNIPRTFVDINRDKIELDEQMFFDYPSEEVTANSRRSRHGLGVIPRINSENKAIYNEKISYEDAMDRIKNVYDVYHKSLEDLINKTRKKFGYCLVLDLHSMPSKVCNIMIDEKQVDFCVSTLFEQSAPQKMWQTFGDKLASSGHRVEYNRPYSGGFITFYYCQPKVKVWTMQLETNRSLYINEKTLEKKDSFENLQKHITESVLALKNTM